MDGGGGLGAGCVVCSANDSEMQQRSTSEVKYPSKYFRILIGAIKTRSWCVSVVGDVRVVHTHTQARVVVIVGFYRLRKLFSSSSLLGKGIFFDACPVASTGYTACDGPGGRPGGKPGGKAGAACTCADPAFPSGASSVRAGALLVSRSPTSPPDTASHGCWELRIPPIIIGGIGKEFGSGDD